MRLGKPLLLAAPLAALAISGCGGGGGGDTTAAAPVTTEATPTLSKEELISQGDAICREVNAAVGTIGAGDSESSSETVQIADVYGGMADNLKGLGEPEDEQGYAEFIEAAELLAQVEDEAKLADEREDGAALEEAEANAATALSAFQSAAAEYGFEDCSDEPSAPAIAPGPGAESPVEEGGAEVAPEEEIAPEEEAAPEEEVEEIAPEEGGGAGAEVAPEEGGGTEAGGGSGGVGPG
jgi:hypothetical protein